MCCPAWQLSYVYLAAVSPFFLLAILLRPVKPGCLCGKEDRFFSFSEMLNSVISLLLVMKFGLCPWWKKKESRHCGMAAILDTSWMLAMDCIADLMEKGEAREHVHGDGARDASVDGEDERHEVAECSELEQTTTCGADGISAERSGCCECLANVIDDSVARLVEVGDAGLRIIIEVAVVSTEQDVVEVSAETSTTRSSSCTSGVSGAHMHELHLRRGAHDTVVTKCRTP